MPKSKKASKKIAIPKKIIAKRQKADFLSKFIFGKEREYIIENLALMSDSGMGVLPSLESIAQGSDSKGIKKIIEQIKTDVQDGAPLWQALELSGLFSERAISLIKIGERSGRLTANLKVASQQQQKERSFSSKIKGALMYPLFVLVVAVLVGLGVAWFILPKLAVVFTQMKIKLPFITKVFIDVGLFLGKYGSIVIPIALVLFLVIIYFIFFFKRTKIAGQFITFSIPIFREIIRDMEVARFGYLAGSLLQAGLPLVNALKLIKETSDFYNYRKFYAYLESSIDEGNTFSKTFANYNGIDKLIPPPMQRTISAAEKSGHLAETLVKIGQIYEERLDDTTKNLTVILEPILLVIVWVGVMAVAFAVILPIYGLIGGLEK